MVLLVVGLAGLASQAQATTPAYELCIEQSPAKAGTVTPRSGTHRFSSDARVTIDADPQPGYRFVYWLGDVHEPTAARTSVYVNGPKIVVAVFEPTGKRHDEREFKLGGGAGGGPGALIPTATDFGPPHWSPAGGSGAWKVTAPGPVVVTPEPTTIGLLALGALALHRRRPARR
jgi:hypothetical protein